MTDQTMDEFSDEELHLQLYLHSINLITLLFSFSHIPTELIKHLIKYAY